MVVLEEVKPETFRLSLIEKIHVAQSRARYGCLGNTLPLTLLICETL